MKGFGDIEMVVGYWVCTLKLDMKDWLTVMRPRTCRAKGLGMAGMAMAAMVKTGDLTGPLQIRTVNVNI